MSTGSSRADPGQASWDSWAALAEKVAFLRRPESFPEGTTAVETVETHMSWVFLSDRYAYKLKKPVRFQLLNLSTLEDRRRNCEAELKWNRRLAPDVYLEAVPLGLDGEGRLTLAHPVTVVDWLVKMRRLPAERMLDRRIASGELERADVVSIAETLARFYRSTPRVPIGPKEYRERFARDIEEIVRELVAISPLPKSLVDQVAAALLRLIERRAPLLESRALEGRVVDCHGDLRPEHVCLLEQPVVIDCLEFRDDLRALDPADELSFLSLECELAGGPGYVEEVLFAIYTGRTGDHPPLPLVRFYQAFRAFLRAKIAIWHLTDPEVGQQEKWIARTERYVRKAEALVPD